jgi:hypothetical protein
MKKIIFIVILLIISVNSTNAQVAWGGRIGLSYYTETIELYDMSGSVKAPGFELGPVLYCSLKNNLYINSGVMLGVMIPEDDADLLGRGDYQNYYIGIPLYLGVNIPVGNGNFSFFLQTGPYIGYWWSSDSDTSEMMNPIQAGLGGMAGINIKRFKFEFGWKGDFTNITSNKAGDTFKGTTLVESTSKLSSLFLGISYVF